MKHALLRFWATDVLTPLEPEFGVNYNIEGEEAILKAIAGLYSKGLNVAIIHKEPQTPDGFDTIIFVDDKQFQVR